MDVFDRRRARLQLLVNQLANGNISEFAKKFGYSRAQVSQFLSEKYNDGRSIGERAARTIELNVGKRIGFLDQEINSVETLIADQKQDRNSIAEQVIRRAQALEPGRPRFTIPVLATFTPTEDGVVEALVNVSNLSIPHILLYTLSTESYAFQVKGGKLQPRVRSGEYLLFDAERKAEPGDDLLVKLTTGEWMIQQFLYMRNDEAFFGSINGASPLAVVPDYDIVAMVPIVAVLSGRLEIIVVEPKENS